MLASRSRAPVRVLVSSRALVRSFGALLLLASGTACSASRHDTGGNDDVPSGDVVDTSDAIVHGAADRGRHPGVVALVIHGTDGTHLCSGALIAPDVVLTARHCVSVLASDAIDCPASGPQVGANRAPSSIEIVTDDVVDGATSAAVGVEIVTPPGDTLCGQDLALVRLDRAIAGIEPLSVDRDPKPLDGERITAIGYGLNRNEPGKAGIRRFRSHVRVTSSSDTEFEVGESTCQGDSGGPAIDETDGTIVGVVSRGGGSCSGKSAMNVYTRLDPFLTMIEGVIGAGPEAPDGSEDAGAPAGDAGHGRKHKPKTPKAPKTDVGDPCKTGATCSAGVCVEPAGYCSHPCGKGHGRCERGYHCSRTKKGELGVCTKKK